MVFIGFRVSKQHPEWFAADALQASLGTLGVVAVFLIALVFFGVSFLRQL